MKRKIRLILPTVLVLIIAIVSGTVTYSWIKRRWTPYVEENNIRVESAGALSFVIDGAITTSASLSQVLGVNELELSPVSSCSGESDDFFYTTIRQEDNRRYFTRVSASGEYKEAALSHKYVDVHFTLKNPSPESGTASTQYLFFHPDTVLTGLEGGGNGFKAVRVAIGINKNDPKIFACDEDFVASGGRNLVHCGITNKKDAAGNWLAEGTDYYVYDNEGNSTGERQSKCKGDPQEDLVTTGNCYSDLGSFIPVKLYRFSDFDGGAEYDENGMPHTDVAENSQKFLCTIPAQGVEVHVRVWLEGEDELCTQEIAGDEFKLIIKFDAVTANGNKN